MRLPPPAVAILLAVASACASLSVLSADNAGTQSQRGAQAMDFGLWYTDTIGPDMWAPHGMDQLYGERIHRHRSFIQHGTPPQYRGMRNPLPPTPEVIREGRVLYTNRCAACHGTTGLGLGDAGKGLNPSPPLLTYMMDLPLSVDEYLMWTVSEGGTPFGTPMPAFKTTLAQDEIWKIITFMRAGFPLAAESD